MGGTREDFRARRRQGLPVPLSVGGVGGVGGRICRDTVRLSVVWLLQLRARIRMETDWADLGPSVPRSNLALERRGGPVGMVLGLCTRQLPR